MRYILPVLAAAISVQAQPADPDFDGDGLSDFQETHKYLTDPARADSDGDGVPDGDWLERREFTYTVRAVIQLLPPFNLAAMTDDYQDARLLDERPGCAELEVILYPFNTSQDSIGEDPQWRSPRPDLAPFLSPGPTNNFDDAMQRDLLAELRESGIDVEHLTDRQAAEQVSQFLMRRSEYEDSFTTFTIELADGQLRVAPAAQHGVDEELAKRGRTLAEQWDREVLGAGMFRTRVHGSCTSSSIYLSTALRAAGLPTRTVVCIPVIDASDPGEAAMPARLENHEVRRAVQKAARQMGDSWASHTFNEVYVGGRWRRLNYDRLGQPILDAGLLGLMVHVNTFNDLAEGGLLTWGLRAGGDHDDIFGHSNPYSCISLSDRFGLHASLANPVPQEAHDRLTISRMYWYTDAGPDGVKMRLDNADTAGHLIVHVDEFIPGEGTGQYGDFYGGVGKDFTLRAEGRDDVHAIATRGYWVDDSKDLRDFYIQIPPEEWGRLADGVGYTLVPSDTESPFAWAVAPGLTITRAAAPPVAAARPDGVEVRTITEAHWAESADAPEWMRTVFEPDGNGHILCHVDEWGAGGFEALRRFTDRADDQFVLEAEGQPSIVADAASGGIADDAGTVREIILFVNAGDLANVRRGVPYTLRPLNEKAGFQWRVSAGLTVTLR